MTFYDELNMEYISKWKLKYSQKILEPKLGFWPSSVTSSDYGLEAEISLWFVKLTLVWMLLVRSYCI